MTAIASQSARTPQKSGQALATLPDMTTRVGQLAHYGAVHTRLRRPANAASSEPPRQKLAPKLRLSAGLPYATPRPSPMEFVSSKRERTSNPLLGRSPATVPPWLQIMREVATKHGLTVFDLEGFNRTRPYCAARHEAMWRMSNELGMSLPVMGRKFGNRDHTTLMHGIRSHALIVATPRERDVLILGERSETFTDPEQIIAAVAAKHNVSVARIKGGQQCILISGARQEIYWRLSTATGLSTVQIGRLVNRDHSTVVLGIRRHVERMAAQ